VCRVVLKHGGLQSTAQGVRARVSKEGQCDSSAMRTTRTH
jgi:hypothetical protein